LLGLALVREGNGPCAGEAHVGKEGGGECWADWARVEFGVGFPGRCWAAGLKWVRLGFGLG